jgi:surfactin synthase thioesterase subunit
MAATSRAAAWLRRAELRRLIMAIAAHSNSLDLAYEMRGCIGHHTDKSFDWDAFPGSHGFPELARAQMRYIGAGGSPKTDDPHTLQPGLLR